jgi:hypothetical protein
MLIAPDLKSRNKGNYPKLKVPKENRRRLKEKLALNDTLVLIKKYYEHLLFDCFTTLDGLYSKADYTRDLARINSRVDSESITFVTKTLPDYINCVLSLVDQKEASFSFLKLRKDSRIPRFLGGLTVLVLESTDQDIAAIALNCLYTICVAFKKLRGSYSKKVLIKQYRSFVEVDTNLPDGINPEVQGIAMVARNLCRNFIKDIDIGDKHFLPRPGPGATNTPTQKNMRYSPHVLYSQIDNVLPYADWFYYNPFAVVYRSREYVELMNNSQHSPTARFKFVPKTYGKARGICIEENEMQVFQQAFRVGLWHFIQNSNIAENLPLTDQTVNGLLALKASLDQTDATIDMSEASDRVTRDLVHYLFQDNPELCEVLMALSTRTIIPPVIDGLESTPLNAKKYAPMGSGLCFPIMSLVHLFIVQAIILTENAPNKRALIKGVRVYGDDIVLPSSCALAVFANMPKFGMKLNYEKSFLSGRFRESCGIHAYNGMDITPVYVKNVPKSDDLTALQSMLANESDFYKKGFYSTAEFLRNLLCKYYPRLKLDRHVSTSTNGFAGFYRCFTPTLLNALKKRCRAKWNSDYQCKMFRVPRFQTRVTTAELTEDEALLRWLWTNTEESRIVDDSVELTIIAWQWVPESHLCTIPAGIDHMPHSPMYCVDGLIW